MLKKSMIYNSDQLQDWILIEASIECQSCKAVKGDMNTDTYYFSEELFDEGWRATGSRVYCPTCASKKLKQ